MCFLIFINQCIPFPIAIGIPCVSWLKRRSGLLSFDYLCRPICESESVKILRHLLCLRHFCRCCFCRRCMCTRLSHRSIPSVKRVTTTNSTLAIWRGRQAARTSVCCVCSHRCSTMPRSVLTLFGQPKMFAASSAIIALIINHKQSVIRRLGRHL